MGMAELDRSVDFDYNSVEMTDRLIQCAQHALPYFSAQVPYSYSQALFQIRDILIQTDLCLRTLENGSGSGSFRQCLSRCQQKISYFVYFFLVGAR
jgi:hypothetical protein